MNKSLSIVIALTLLTLVACKPAAPAVMLKVTNAGTQVAAFSGDDINEINCSGSRLHR